MRRGLFRLVVALAVGIVVGVTGDQVLNAQQAPLKATDLLRTEITGMEGKEAVLQLVEFAPRGATGSHYHPGHETAYVLEGSVILEMEGYPSRALKAGDSSYVPAKHIHGGKNASATDPVKILVFRIHEKGQPITVGVTEPHFWK